MAIKKPFSPPFYKQVDFWIKNYGGAGMTDQEAVATFMECETKEMVVMLQGELRSISAGKYDQDIFDKVVGVKRRAKHSSYDEWARLMLLWIANYKG